MKTTIEVVELYDVRHADELGLRKAIDGLRNRLPLADAVAGCDEGDGDYHYQISGRSKPKSVRVVRKGARK